MSALPAWFALGMMIGAAFACVAAVRTRSLFVLCLNLAAAGALGASALVALSAGEAGLGLALLMAGVAPFVLLATLLLSSRTAKGARSETPWLTILAALAVGAGILVAAPDLKGTPTAQDASAPLTLWLAPLAFVGLVSALALAGFGERGQLDRAPEREL